jgi:hypothetical protein
MKINKSTYIMIKTIFTLSIAAVTLLVASPTFSQAPVGYVESDSNGVGVIRIDITALPDYFYFQVDKTQGDCLAGEWLQWRGGQN